MSVEEMIELIHRHLPVYAQTQENIGEPIIAALKAGQAMRDELVSIHERLNNRNNEYLGYKKYKDYGPCVEAWDAATGGDV